MPLKRKYVPAKFFWNFVETAKINTHKKILKQAIREMQFFLEKNRENSTIKVVWAQLQ